MIKRLERVWARRGKSRRVPVSFVRAIYEPRSGQTGKQGLGYLLRSRGASRAVTVAQLQRLLVGSLPWPPLRRVSVAYSLICSWQ